MCPEVQVERRSWELVACLENMEESVSTGGRKSRISWLPTRRSMVTARFPEGKFFDWSVTT